MNVGQAVSGGGPGATRTTNGAHIPPRAQLSYGLCVLSVEAPGWAMAYQLKVGADEPQCAHRRVCQLEVCGTTCRRA